MARMPRIYLSGQPVHVIQRGNNRSATFFVEDDHRFYLECMREAARKYECAIHAYVLMTNHVHVLLTPNAGQALPGFMQSVGRRYVRYINHTYRRTGTLWEGRYKSALIDSERYLLTCYRYIELNPVRAAMVAAPGDYPWSSYAHNAGVAANALITPHDVYMHLGDRPEQRQHVYRSLFDRRLEEDAIKSIRDATNAGGVVGNERFKDEIEVTLQRRVDRYPHGGDRRSETFRERR